MLYLICFSIFISVHQVTEDPIICHNLLKDQDIQYLLSVPVAEIIINRMDIIDIDKRLMNDNIL